MRGGHGAAHCADKGMCQVQMGISLFGSELIALFPQISRFVYMDRYIIYIQFIHIQSQRPEVQSHGRTLSGTICWRDSKAALQPHRPVLPDGTATGSDEVSQSYGVEGVCLEINVSYDTLCEYPIPRRLRSLCRREAPGGDVDMGKCCLRASDRTSAPVAVPSGSIGCRRGDEEV